MCQWYMNKCQLNLCNWEYHVLTVDTREMDIPDTVQLNELGAQGWLLVGIVDQSTTGSGSMEAKIRRSRDYVSQENWIGRGKEEIL